MTDLCSQLDECFASVFPKLASEELRCLTSRTSEAWDSMATITLIGLIEEHFNVEIPPEDVPNLLSYSEILNYLSLMQQPR